MVADITYLSEPNLNRNIYQHLRYCQFCQLWKFNLSEAIYPTDLN